MFEGLTYQTHPPGLALLAQGGIFWVQGAAQRKKTVHIPMVDWRKDKWIGGVERDRNVAQMTAKESWVENADG
jgi:hypothetical protein